MSEISVLPFEDSNKSSFLMTTIDNDDMTLMLLLTIMMQ